MFREWKKDEMRELSCINIIFILRKVDRRKDRMRARAGGRTHSKRGEGRGGQIRRNARSGKY